MALSFMPPAEVARSASNVATGEPPAISTLARGNGLLREGEAVPAIEAYADAVLEAEDLHPSILLNFEVARDAFQREHHGTYPPLLIVAADNAADRLKQVPEQAAETNARVVHAPSFDAHGENLSEWARAVFAFAAHHPATRLTVATDFILAAVIAFFYRVLWGAEIRAYTIGTPGADWSLSYWQQVFNEGTDLPRDLQLSQQINWASARGRQLFDFLASWDVEKSVFTKLFDSSATAAATQPIAAAQPMSAARLLHPLLEESRLGVLAPALDGGRLEALIAQEEKAPTQTRLEPRVHQGRNHLSRPELFDLKAEPAGSSTLLFGHAHSLWEARNILRQAEGWTEDFDLVLSLDASAWLPGMLACNSGHVRRFDVLLMPESATGASALTLLVQGGVNRRYDTIVLLPATSAPAAGAETLNSLTLTPLPNVGIEAEGWSTLDRQGNEFSNFWLGQWFERYGHPAPSCTSPVPTGLTSVRGLLVEQLAAMRVSPEELEPSDPELRAGCDVAIRGALGALAEAGGFDRVLFDEVRPNSRATSPSSSSAKLVAFYLPQFHAIPENDEWWGQGFTEWHNVAKATPLFRHHYQPKLPADLGFYDLRRPDNQEAQAALAREHGIHGFCYYYYWFDGKKLLEHPIEQMLRSGKPDFPFCVCWANENWTRQWDGQQRHILMSQSYSQESNKALIGEFIRMMKDPRYIRHEGKPVLIVYRICLIPDWNSVAAMWREECRNAGLGEIHLCSVRFSREPLEGPPQDHGLDAYVLFPPQDMAHVDSSEELSGVHSNFRGNLFSYQEMAKHDLERFNAGYPWPVHRGVTLGWDNTARRRHRARIFTGCSPMRYRAWLKGVLDQEQRYHPDGESLVFINAWNEWAEGTYLEPDQRYGKSYLAATRSALLGARKT
jgi:hypothetical protein